MDIVYSFISREIVEALGWTLFHSLWQGALVAILFGLLLLALPKFSAHTRYIISMVALFIVLGLSVTTFVRTYRYAVEKEKLREQVVSNPEAALEQFRATLAEAGKANTGSTVDSKWMLKWVIFKTYFQRQFPLIVLIWMLGMLVLMLRFMGGLIYANRMKYRGVFPADDNWMEVTKRFSGKLAIKRAVTIYQSAMTKIPVTLGYFKPVVLIPISIFTNVPPVQIENIIAHELAHVARYDYMFNILQRFVEILFFYHPAVWWISSIARTEREHSCDDIAVELTGDSLTFAKTLAAMHEHAADPQPGYAMAFTQHKNKLFNRVKRILTQPVMKKNFNEGFIASCVIFAGILVITLGAAPSAHQKNYTETNAQIDSLKPANALRDTVPASADQDIPTPDEPTEAPAPKEQKQEIYKQLGDLNLQNGELQKQLEVLLGDIDNTDTREVLKGVQGALHQMDLNAIVNEAMKGANAALNNIDINAIVSESMKKDGEPKDVDKITREALKGANAALQNMDLNLIVNEALKGADGALREMDLNKIVNESLDKEINKKKEFHETKSSNKYKDVLKNGSDAWNKWRTDNTRIVPDLSNMHLYELNLQKADFSDLSLTGSKFEKSDFRKANFTGCNASEFYLGESMANDADFQNATFIDSRFYMSSLLRCNFRNANLNGTSFMNCNISDADFRNANIRNADFTGGVMDKCNFKGAIANHNTKFPKDFDWEKEGIRME